MAGFAPASFFNYCLPRSASPRFLSSYRSFAAVKFAGALYLVYSADKACAKQPELWRAGEGEVPVGARTTRDSWKRYREGLLTNALNPKIAVFYFAVLPQFIKAGDPVLLKSLLMAACHYVMGALWPSGIALVAGKSRALVTRPRVKATLETVSGCAMIGFGARLAFARARKAERGIAPLSRAAGIIRDFSTTAY